MIAGEVLRAGLRLAMLLLVLSSVTLLFQDRSSAGFVVAVMSLVVSILFVIAVLVFASLGAARLPRNDKEAAKGYNTRRSVRTQRGRDE